MNEFAQILVEFNNKAKKMFFSTYEKFTESVKRLDRAKDDNVFQQQQGKYLKTLKDQLEMLAREILYKSRSIENSAQLNKKLTGEIDLYVQEFRQKSKSL